MSEHPNPSVIPSKRPPHPNLDRADEVHERSQAIGDFLSWLTDNHKIILAERSRATNRLNAVVPTDLQVNQWLAEFYGIDHVEMERERQALLEWVRAAQPEGGAHGRGA